MKIDVATLFPEAFDGLKVGIIAKALQKELFSLSLHNIRDYSADKHRRCDDYPFGGIETYILYGYPKTLIANFNESKEKIDLIVMGATGLNAVERVLVGSTTSYVVTHAPCNVLVVK